MTTAIIRSISSKRNTKPFKGGTVHVNPATLYALLPSAAIAALTDMPAKQHTVTRRPLARLRLAPRRTTIIARLIQDRVVNTQYLRNISYNYDDGLGREHDHALHNLDDRRNPVCYDFEIDPGRGTETGRNDNIENTRNTDYDERRPFIIIRRLRRTAQIVQESKRGSSTANQTTTSAKPGYATATVTEVDAQEIDPLSIRPSHLRAQSDPSVDGRGRHYSPARSPGLSSGRSTPPAWPGQYNPVPHNEEGARHPSIDSANGGYYDAGRVSQMSQRTVQRSSYDSEMSQSRNRHWSNASELDGAHGLSELDTSEAGGRRRSSSGAGRPSLAHGRRSSDPHQRGRSDSSTPGIAPLGTVSEANELHGYYGPPDRQVGQTAARVQPGPSTTPPGTAN
ncbi:uncharacterized protein JN550_005850 [Neoarthrinium moseri]|uniref:uncharacterized protein n=1 Tax=Neoarthrinium moseri TaxID=1658444 RepID=UPI001FDCA806|nr:uncharacterized protein JN550_005850 [Neoarthrinium moseri]KAI1869220.1 hypothetical protein JN550_005850 [Neoarthrinium moseri]